VGDIKRNQLVGRIMIRRYESQRWRVTPEPAALNNREMLPWDVWGAMRRQDGELDLGFFDRLASVSPEPDADVDELRALYRDERVSVPGSVFNAVLYCLQEL
jgi:hypothetical protein